MSKKKVLITGASGFVGSVLSRKMLHEGHDVHAIVRNDSAWRLKDIRKHLNCLPLDLCANGYELSKEIPHINPDLIYHCATYGGNSFQKDANLTIQTNIVGTWNLLQATSKVDYQLFVNVGSSSEYGFKTHPMAETDVLEPNSYYSMSKGSQTLMCQYFAKSENKPILNYRLFGIYGPYEEPTKLIPTVVRNCLHNEDLKLASPDIAHDYLFVDDLMEAFMVNGVKKENYGEIFNIGSGVQTTIKNVVDDVFLLTNSESKCIWNYYRDSPLSTKTWVGNCEKAKNVLGWFAKTKFIDGLRKTIEWTKNEIY